MYFIRRILRNSQPVAGLENYTGHAFEEKDTQNYSTKLFQDTVMLI